MNSSSARAKLAFFGDDDDDLNLQSKPVDELKAKTYTQGVHRKSKREKEKEAELAKKEEEERDAAKAYAEFLDAFDSPDAPTSSGSKTRTPGFVKASGGTGRGEAYESASKSRDGIPTGPRGQQRRQPTPPPVAGAQKPKGKRAMDAFLEELKRDQADREARLKNKTQSTGSSVTALAAFEGQHGSRDRGDPLTTNIFVANLPMGVTEQSLGMFFARHGPVGSVKIMWPRSDVVAPGPGGDITARRGKAAGMSGFVSYMTRRAAEECVRDMDGFNWGGSVLRVGWSKAVPIAAKPAYVLEDDKRRHSRSRSRSRSRSPRPSKKARYNYGSRESRSRSRPKSPSVERYSRRRHSDSMSRSRSPPRRRRADSYDRRSRSRSHSGDRYHSRRDSSPHRGDDGYSRKKGRSRSPRRSRSPKRRWPAIEADAREVVANAAGRIKNLGSRGLDDLKRREKHNPKYSFLFDKRMPEYHLFRSLSDLKYDCPYADIAFNDDGANSAYSTDSAEESERERARKGSLGRLAERRFESMLRGLTGKRGEIARCMAFSLEHADAVVEVVDVIMSSLVVESTAVPRKVARLHLICDILHNAAASIPNAWKFRGEFQARLPGVFDHLSDIYHSFPGRITAETFKRQILAVVEVWEDWIIFPPEFTAELRQRLDGVKDSSQGNGADVDGEEAIDLDGEASLPVPVSSKFKTSTFTPAVDPPAAADSDDMELGSDDDDIEGEAIALDGDEMPLEDA